jgi:RNA polymerase sigma-70 factor (ECF subfamily)
MRADFDLLQAWRAGDMLAGDELFSRHFADVFGFFRSKVDLVAEDLTQQTFMQCVQARDEFRQAASFRTYVFVVARNVLYSYLRRQMRASANVDFSVTSIADVGVPPSGLLAEREDLKLLVHALRRLPVDLQVALELYYVQEIRGQELVEALGIPPGTARSRIRRGLEQLRANMSALAASPQRIKTTLTDLARWAAELRPPKDPPDAFDEGE